MSNLDALENEVEQERAKLSQTLDSLTDTLAPEKLISRVTSSVEGYGGEFGRQAWTSAKQNPASLALLAAGLGLLFTGTGSRDVRASRMQAAGPMDAMDGFDERVAKADAAIKSNMATPTAAPRASWLRETLEVGIDKLPPHARARVIKARKSAIAAQERVEAEAERLARKTSSFHNNQPLAIGALALGAGALIAALLPSTRREDDLLGEQRDAMLFKAREVLKSEMDEFTSAARGALNTGANRDGHPGSNSRTNFR